MTGKTLVELIERKRASYDSEFDGEVPFTNDEAETLFREIERLQSLAQAAGYTDVGGALKALIEHNEMMADACERHG